MREILYLEIPTADTATVLYWLQNKFQPGTGEKVLTPSGFRLRTCDPNTPGSANFPEKLACELSVFVWSVQRTTYLKVFRWADRPFSDEAQILKRLTTGIRSRFPHEYPEPPAIDLSSSTIFEALAPYYPLTAKYFQKMPNGESDLKRVYWWEQRWREGVLHPQQPIQVIFSQEQGENFTASPHPKYDLIYIGGALGVIHAAVMARLGYKVLLVERLQFGRMNREWNISRDEIQSLINLGLLTPAEVETIIAREYKDGFNKFFDANNPPKLRAPILHTPTVLNVALDSEKWLRLCGEKTASSRGGNLGTNGVYPC